MASDVEEMAVCGTRGSGAVAAAQPRRGPSPFDLSEPTPDPRAMPGLLLKILERSQGDGSPGALQFADHEAEPRMEKRAFARVVLRAVFEGMGRVLLGLERQIWLSAHVFSNLDRDAFRWLWDTLACFCP